MESNLEECEIKIEYNESFESDPLIPDDAYGVDKKTKLDNLKRQRMYTRARFTKAKHEVEDTIKALINIDRANYLKFKAIFKNFSVLAGILFKEDLQAQELNADLEGDIEHVIQEKYQNDWQNMRDRYSEIVSQYEHLLDNSPVTDNVKDLNAEENTEKMPQEDETAWYIPVDSTRRLKCHFCDLCYSTVPKIRYHVKTNHPEQVKHFKNIIIISKRSKKLKCHICHDRFELTKDLQLHVEQIHSLETIKTSCNYCNASVKDGKEMNYHLYNVHKKIIHTLFSCSVCGYRTPKKSHFTQHEKTHLNESFKCQYCEYASYSKYNLTVHTRIHTNEKPYVCEFSGCSYRSTTKSGLKIHSLRHYPDKNMLYCDQCSYKTVFKQSLKRHMEIHRRICVKLIKSTENNNL